MEPTTLDPFEKPGSVERTAISGSLLSISSRLFTTISGFIRAIVLVRLLIPADFGAYAFASFFYLMLASLKSWGLNEALIQKTNPGQDDAAAHFLGTLSLSGAVFLLSIPGCLVLRFLYPEQSLLPILVMCLAAIDLFESPNQTPLALLRNRLQFKSYYSITVVCSALATLISIVMAVLGAGIWSLLGVPVGGLLGRVMSLWVIRRIWKPTFRTSRFHIKSLFTFGRPIFYSNALQVVLNQFDDFWIGTMSGATTLGYYNRAFEFSQYGAQLSTNALLAVFLPVFSKLKNDKPSLSRAFEQSTGIVTRIAIFVAGCILVAGDDLIRVAIGERWLQILPILEIMTIFVVASSYVSSSTTLLISVGNHQMIGRLKLLQVIVFVPCVIFMNQLFGSAGVAGALALSSLSAVVFITPHVKSTVQFSLQSMFAVPVLSMTSIVAVWRLFRLNLLVNTTAMSLIVGIGFVTVLYALGIYVFERNKWHAAIRFVATHQGGKSGSDSDGVK